MEPGLRSAAPLQDHRDRHVPTLAPIGYPQGPAWIESPATSTSRRRGPRLWAKIRTNDSRIQNVVYRNGKLWATHTVFPPAPTRASVQWWQVRTDATVAQRGLVDDPVRPRFYAFPSIAVNKNDDAMLGYSRFQGDQYAGASYSFRTWRSTARTPCSRRAC